MYLGRYMFYLISIKVVSVESISDITFRAPTARWPGVRIPTSDKYGQLSKFCVCFCGLDPGNWNLRQYGRISNMFAFRIWDAQFEFSRFEIMKTDRKDAPGATQSAKANSIAVFLLSQLGVHQLYESQQLRQRTSRLQSYWSRPYSL